MVNCACNMTVTVTTHWCGGEEPAAAATSALNHPALVLFADQISDSTAPLAPHIIKIITTTIIIFYGAG